MPAFYCTLKSRAFSAGVIPARQLSFQPVAIGAAMSESRMREIRVSGSMSER